VITANQFNVADVLGDAFVHEIPPYQRGLTHGWRSRRSSSLRTCAEPYFLGSIVLIKPQGQKISQVVDAEGGTP
jgi:hypothetical protein